MKPGIKFVWIANSLTWVWLAIGTPSFPQTIIPDTSLPVNSIVTPQGNISHITGGTTVGGNLFHSFSQFSVPTGNTVFFNNSTDVQNIITRVTGSSPSNLDGLLKANVPANLFLINPNGIIFGPHASLNIGGSFFATTANSLKFANGTEFSAIKPQAPLLSINMPIGLQFGANPGSIINQSQTTNSNNQVVGLQVPLGKTLALLGGNLTLTGGNLTAESGQIELGSVAVAGTVTLGVNGNGYLFNYAGIKNFGDIQLSQGAIVDTSGDGGGNINVQGQRLSLTDGSEIISLTLGTKPGGNLTVNTTDLVEIIGQSADGTFPSALLTEVVGSSAGINPRIGKEGSGHGGNLTINTSKLVIQNSGVASTSTYSSGTAGDLIVNASDSVQIMGDGSTGLFATTTDNGDAGNLTVNTKQLIMQGQPEITTSTFANGNAAKLTINASDIQLMGGSYISAVSNPGSQGNGGNVAINTGNLLLQNGSQVEVGTFGIGQGGNLAVNATGSIEVVGRSADGLYPSGLFSQVDQGATGNSGSVTITTGSLSIQGGAKVSAGTITGTSGMGGDLTIKASNSIEVTGTGIDNNGLSVPSRLFVESQGSGMAGDLRISTNKLIIDQGATVTASAASAGGGNIDLAAQQLLLRHHSKLSAEAGGTGVGGNITLDLPTGSITLLENSTITANAFQGYGGNILINAKSVFAPTPSEQITASSAAGLKFNGVVQIKTPDLDPSKGILNISQKVLNINNQIYKSCSHVDGYKNQFTFTGSGGLPTNPHDVITAESTLSNWEVLSPPTNPLTEEQISHAIPQNKKFMPSQITRPDRIVEAKNWMVNEKGQVILTALPVTITYQPWFPSGCLVK